MRAFWRWIVCTFTHRADWLYYPTYHDGGYTRCYRCSRQWDG
jgi:hypothetical protein